MHLIGGGGATASSLTHIREYWWRKNNRHNVNQLRNYAIRTQCEYMLLNTDVFHLTHRIIKRMQLIQHVYRNIVLYTLGVPYLLLDVQIASVL